VTFSIAAYCKQTKAFGLATATYSPAIGARGPVVVPNKGAVMVQSCTSYVLTRLAARLVESGLSAEKIAQELQASDPYAPERQICVVDQYGRAFGVTGSANPGWAGHKVGAGYVCAGNVLVGEAVVDEMAAAFERAEALPLAERLLRAIEAGRDAGGQPEGQTSSALVVYGTSDVPVIDLRVDVHEEPVGEMRRIYDWYAPMGDYYIRRDVNPDMPRWFHWRDKQIEDRRKTASK
jgi:uncharacterized Ntn-hydrolase superfamily protein